MHGIVVLASPFLIITLIVCMLLCAQSKAEFGEKLFDFAIMSMSLVSILLLLAFGGSV